MNFFKFFATGGRAAFAEFQPEPETVETAPYDLYIHIETGLAGHLRHVPAEMLNGEPDGAWRIDFLPNGAGEFGRWVTADDVMHIDDAFMFEVA